MSRELVQSIRQHLKEALPLRQAIDYSRGWNRKRYDKAFGGKYRLFLPLDHLQKVDLSVDPYDVRIPQEIIDALSHTDYDYPDETEYLQGLISKDRRVFKLGRVLQKLDPSGRLLNIFNSDPQRVGTNLKGRDLMLVISRHPYDIAGMSTDRGWTSCMELPNPKNRFGGCNQAYVSDDIKLGTIIAYLTKKNDTNLQHPIGRVLVKPYFTHSGRKFTLVVSGNVYGVMPENIRAEVERWVKENQDALSTAKSSPFSSFYLPSDLYQDSEDPDVVSYGEASKRLLSIINSDDIEEFKKIKRLDYNDEIYDTERDEIAPPVWIAITAGAWQILEYLVQQPKLKPFSVANVDLDQCPQSIIDLIVKKNLFLESDLYPPRILSPLVIKTLAVHNPLYPVLPAILFNTIVQYCSQGNYHQDHLAFITHLLEAGVPLESNKDLQVISNRKIIRSKYIYDIVATKSFPEVVKLRIPLGGLRSLLLLLQKHGGERHPREPRVIVRKSLLF